MHIKMRLDAHHAKFSFCNCSFVCVCHGMAYIRYWWCTYMDGINSNTYILRRMDHYIEWYYDDGDALLCFTAQRQSTKNTKHKTQRR